MNYDHNILQEKTNVHASDTSGNLSLTPAFERNNIPIIFNFSRGYVPPFSVCLLTAIQNFSDSNNYDIIILERALTDEQKKIISDIIADHRNVSVRYLDPGVFFKNMKYFMADRLPVEGFFRAAASFFLTNYDKVVYLDSDILIKADIADLYAVDVEGYYVAAVQDIVSKAFLAMKKKTPYAADYIFRARYKMKLSEPDKYFNSGVLVFNCAEIREHFVWQDMLDFWESVEFKCDDQDMFNSLFQGHVKFMGYEWNVFARQHEDFAKVYEEAPKEEYQAYLEARKTPKIVHFITEVKPWHLGQGDFVADFWRVARQSPYYEALLLTMIQHMTRGDIDYCNYRIDHLNPFVKIREFCGRASKKIFNIFCPPGTLRHEKFKKMYFRFRGWDYIPPLLPSGDFKEEVDESA